MAYGYQNEFIKIMSNKVDELLVTIYSQMEARMWLNTRLRFCSDLVTAGASFLVIFTKDSLSDGFASMIFFEIIYSLFEY